MTSAPINIFYLNRTAYSYNKKYKCNIKYNRFW